ncbi:hypothetical protein UY3_07988 [Chelonia mydas]|uniref:Uncharacterized protein n=1 Tax=Chelonia mydas TaxID=8469 RepID=M7BAA0_CHEMY|nr:hypothetical protein UY3_07988 [Chelonia mydas]
MLLPAAPIGLERRTAATWSRDRPNLRTQQFGEFVMKCFSQEKALGEKFHPALGVDIFWEVNAGSEE